MNRLMRTLISLANFKKAKHTSGQIATLLVLLLTVMLIFVMVTANIGQVAVDATTVANAADTAVLLLGSQLATKAQMLSTALHEVDGCNDSIECCETTGFLDYLLGFVGAVVGVVICVVSWGTGCGFGAMLFAATVGGIVGGMTGAAIQGTSIVQGAATGGAIGFAVGSIATGVTGTASKFFLGKLGVSTLFGLSATMTPIIINTSMVAFGGLGLASSIYNAAASNQIVGNMFHQLAQDIAKLGERDQIREGVIFAALYRAIDDPTKHIDEHDVDADYDKYELVPRFAWWWHERMRKFESIRNKQIPEVQRFLNIMRGFRDTMAGAYAGSPGVLTVPGYCGGEEQNPCAPWDDLGECTPGATGALERKDYKWSLEIDHGRIKRTILDGGSVKDGSIVRLLCGLWGTTGTYKIRDANGKVIWRPGPTAQDMMTWLATPCKHSKPVSSTNCPPAPNSYDGIDSMADGIRRMVFYMDTISPPGFNEWAAAQSGNIWCFPGDPAAPSMQSLYDKFVANNLGNASSNWETWRRRFYNSKKPKDSKTYYFKLGEWIALLSDLKTKLLKYTKQNSPLPVCEPGHYVDVAEDIAAPSYQCQYCQPGHPPPCLASPISGYGCPDTCGECSKSALPCRIARSQDKPIGGIIVEDEDGKGGNGEALVRAIKAINRLIKSMSDFRAEIPVWSDNMDAYLQELAAKDFEKDFGGYPTVTYRWTDSRGYNSVVVTVGDFIIPHIDDESRDTGWFSTDECIVLKDYADLYDNCWVRVTKYPPSKDLSTVTVSMGALGKFNPFNRGVTKKSYAEYNIDDKDSGAKNHVSLVDK